MRDKIGISVFFQVTALGVMLLLTGSAVHAQVSGGIDVNTSKMAGDQSECAIAKNPSNKLQLFVMCNNNAGAGMFAARSIDGGVTWVYPDPSKTIANGVNLALGPAAIGDPSLAWDTFGNLFLTYIDSGVRNIVTLLSTDGGQTFALLAQFGPASVDQPTVTTDSGEIWIAWNQGGQMVTRGAAVTGLGVANVGAFNALQLIPGTANCSFGDVAISPGGAVVQVCETPTGGVGPASLLVNIKADGLGPNPFGAAITATTTNVGGGKLIPAQNVRTIDAEAGLAYDRNPASPHFRRLYLVYTEENVFGSNDTTSWFEPRTMTVRLGARPSASMTMLRFVASSYPKSRPIVYRATSGPAGTMREIQRPTLPCRCFAPSRRPPAYRQPSWRTRRSATALRPVAPMPTNSGTIPAWPTSRA